LPPKSDKMQGAAIILKIHLLPRASRDEIVGLHGDALKVRITAPPLEGKANKALKRFIAKKLNLSSSQVAIIAGERSREKILKISGVTQEDVEKALGISLPRQ
jgi:uncharacterized protein (TIGR00251 family)